MHKNFKKEYDFSKGERGRFYHQEAQLNLLAYMEPDIAESIKKHVIQKKY